MQRWHATIYYRTENGIVETEHDLGELEELHHIVERGPHFDTVSWIKIDRIPLKGYETFTVEAAAKE